MGILDNAINMATKQFTNKEVKTINSLPQSEADLIERRKHAEYIVNKT